MYDTLVAVLTQIHDVGKSINEAVPGPVWALVTFALMWGLRRAFVKAPAEPKPVDPRDTLGDQIVAMLGASEWNIGQYYARIDSSNSAERPCIVSKSADGGHIRIGFPTITIGADKKMVVSPGYETDIRHANVAVSERSIRDLIPARTRTVIDKAAHEVYRAAADAAQRKEAGDVVASLRGPLAPRDA